ncbi:MAG: hypothetical protein AAGH71_02620 [Planctomycetota bacterium]
MDAPIEEVLVDAHWWELAGHHDPAAVTDAWRVLHYAAQAVAELGKGWAEERADDSHSTLVWVPDHDRLHDQFFAGRLSVGERPARVVLRPWDMQLFLVDAEGEPLDSVGLEGKTSDDSVAWVRERGLSLLGEARQASRAAPDLPEHPLGRGASFSEPNQLAVAEMIRLYSNTDALLQALIESVAGEGDGHAEALIWPHHFDLASLLIVDRASDGSMASTVGVGLTPPDALVDEGYWYVSPWSSRPVDGRGVPPLDAGRWIERAGALPVAVLPTSAVTSSQDPAVQQRRVAWFVASAYRACRKALADG